MHESEFEVEDVEGVKDDDDDDVLEVLVSMKIEGVVVVVVVEVEVEVEEDVAEELKKSASLSILIRFLMVNWDLDWCGTERMSGGCTKINRPC